MARNVDPLDSAVVSITLFKAGNTDNVIPQTAQLRGTARSLKPEVRNLIERLVAVTDKDFLAEEDLPLEFHFAQLEPERSGSKSLFEEATNTFERNFLLRALEKCGWNVTGTAEYLGIPLSTLKYKMDKLDVRQLAKRLRGV